MPKKRKVETNLSRLIKGMGLTLAEFARLIGVSASTIKKTVEGIRPMSQELRARIFAETGVVFVDEKFDDKPLVYTKEDHHKFKNESHLNEEGAKIAARVIGKQVELLLVAAARPTVGKVMPIFTALNLAMDKIKDEYHLEKSIDAVLRERHSTETKVYLVKELRENDLLAKQVGFQDDPKFKDAETFPLTRTVGWSPAKDIFNVMWQNREFFAELLKSKNEEMTKEQEEKYLIIKAEMQREIDGFMLKFTPPKPATSSPSQI
jgi:transcriptional regulator with XRE-family HTH domain